MRKPIVHLYAVCWNEAPMLGFFFRHYDSWIDRYVIFDDGSTDGSREILQAKPKVEMRDFTRVVPDSFVLSHTATLNTAWKENRGAADWIVIVDIDEHLLVKDRTMIDYLADQTECGVTLIPAIGFGMYHPEMPDDQGLLTSRVTRGRPRSVFNKPSLFNPKALRETNFTFGRHSADPVGDVMLPPRDELMLWHYKHLGFERTLERHRALGARRGPSDITSGFGVHYFYSQEKMRAFWDELEQEATDLNTSDLIPDQVCARPLWWEERGDFVRVPAAPLPQLAHYPVAGDRTPAVSVLLKAYNHAPYIGQTIESVLDQSFEDFEIVVTDDGSSDATLHIVENFRDPRLRVEAFPDNRGISAAMNATIARARGRYFAIINSDDWMLPGRLRKQVAFLENNPEVSLVFGLPRTVDEEGLPAPAFNDFTEPLRLPDFSRRTWLRHFFDNGNCLCAPTAMIRREAYEAAGPYDRRLTNLQDFDMWVRMLLAGHNIHVLPEKLSAFRIRAKNANASAPTQATQLRSLYETTKILHRFAAMDADLFDDVFGADSGSSDRKVSPALRLAELAREGRRDAHRIFALDCLYENAHSSEDIRRLRQWAGSMDVFNVLAAERLRSDIHERDRKIAELGDASRRHEGTMAVLAENVRQRDDAISALNEAIRQRDLTIEELASRAEDVSRMLTSEACKAKHLGDELQNVRALLTSTENELAETAASREAMLSSWSWRSTRLIRLIEKAIRQGAMRL